MNYLLGLINRAVGDEQLTRLLFAALIGLSVVLVVATLAILVKGLQSPVQRRLMLIKRGHGVDLRAPPSNLQMMLEQVGQRFNSGEPGQSSATRSLLTHAGYRSPSAVQVYWAIRLLLPLLLVGITLMALPFIPNLSLLLGVGLLVVVLGVGWLAPAVYVGARKEARMSRLLIAFPDALDLMVVCVESGLALPQAIERVAEEMAVSQPDLALELALVNAEVRAGVPSTEALKHLAERTGLEDIRGLVSLLAQSIRFGTSVGTTLRIYAEEFRDRRTQMAEEKAAKVGTKLVFPLIFCLWPSFFLVAIGPAIISVFKVFGKI
ncbi:type II secretion system F family protein [Pseudomonas psychrophila]|uniref:Tight adherence protein C n=1 Tax=Pseudomonas psychrophila TaxID=122355 RepID=A0ABY0W3X6_9PSED|nr:type II secretion system F family protein [Pseudomonas psychrophila]KAB0490961.1 type II secretion system F family protein [Pseudomonas psychrophila]KMM99897.1 type II secretion system protein [Pseudomonas psychrophila]QIE34428.1 type II secretion system F family protein [Pseudomonas psychrophila]WVI96528.1 type II secretion system F family protein [Pseudomonas psychrophila]SDU71983.1 tight adherence protein C [Pseudomonas psychrophila]